MTEDLWARIARLTGLTVTDPYPELTAGDCSQFGPGAGGYHMHEELGRCARCDSRYCWDGCYAGVPGYVYVVGHGYIPFADARAIEAEWDAAGLDHGLDHGFRRVEWDRAVAPAATSHPTSTVRINRKGA